MMQKLKKWGNAAVLLLLIGYGLLGYWSLSTWEVIRSKQVSVRFYIKSTVPFIFTPLSVMEWILPLCFVLAYVFWTVGAKKIYYIVTAVIIGALLKNMWIDNGDQLRSFFGKYLDENLGIYLKDYFFIWTWIALFVLLIVPAVWKRFGKNRKGRILLGSLVFLIALGEGVLLNVVYFGTYTCFYAGRSILLLGLIMYSVLKTEETGLVEKENADCQKQGRLLPIGVVTCVCLYFICGLISLLSRGNAYYYLRWGFYAYEENLISYYMLGALSSACALLITAAFSLYAVKKEKCGMNNIFWILIFIFLTWLFEMDFLKSYGGRVYQTSQRVLLPVILVFMVVFFILWNQIARAGKVRKIVFLTGMYALTGYSIFRNMKGIEVVGTHVDKYVGFVETHVDKYLLLFQMFLCMVMFILVLYAVCKMPKKEPDSQVIYKIDLAAGVPIFMFMCIFAVVIIRMAHIPVRWLERIYLGEIRFYWILPFVTAAFYLFHAMKQRERQVLCTIFLSTYMWKILFNFNYGSHLLSPEHIYGLISISLIFVLQIFGFLFPRQEKKAGMIFALLTYGLMFCHYYRAGLMFCPYHGEPLNQFHLGHLPSRLPTLAFLVLALLMAIISIIAYAKKETGSRAVWHGFRKREKKITPLS